MKKDLQQRLNKLINSGADLFNAMLYEVHGEAFKDVIKKEIKSAPKRKKFFEKLPQFSKEYQTWYSESQAVIKEVLPDRYNDFVSHYEKPKSRKEIKYGNYVISDYLQTLKVTRGGSTVVGPSAAISEMEQQLSILKSANVVFESKLFNLSSTLFADILDSEIDQSRVLLKNGFTRAAGAISGVVLEGHLAQIVKNHNLTCVKKKPKISDYNQILKDEGVIESPTWRKIQYLNDIRNLCDHKLKEPTKEQVSELIDETEKIIKNIF